MNTVIEFFYLFFLLPYSVFVTILLVVTYHNLKKFKKLLKILNKSFSNIVPATADVRAGIPHAKT